MFLPGAVNYVFVYSIDPLTVVLILYSVLCSIDVALYSHFFLVGDFNIDFTSHNHPLYCKLLSITSSFVLTQVVSEPTHFSHAGVPSMIDLVFTSCLSNIIACNTITPLSNSDHMGILVPYKIPHTNKHANSLPREVWCYSLGDYAKACDMLDNIDWDCLLCKSDIDQCWARWHNVFCNVISECVPKKILPSKKHLPWISPSICKAMKMRNSLFKAYKSTGNHLKFLKYKLCRNRIVTELRKAKLNFFKKIQTSDSKTFWKLIKVLTRRTSSIPTLCAPDSHLIHDDASKDNILNDQFSNNFNHSFTPADHCMECHFPDATFPEEFLCT